jgi:GTPase SAR1 family protein
LIISEEGVVVTMLIPGTNIDVSLKVDRIYIVDPAVTRRMKFAGKSFKDVMEEVQRFTYLRGFNVPHPILKFILKRIGLPEVDIIPGEDELTKDDLLELSRALNVLDALKDEFLSPTGKSVIPEDAKANVIETSVEPEDLKTDVPADLMTDVPADLKTDVPAPQTMSIWDIPASEEVKDLVFSFHSENLPTVTPTPRTQTSDDDVKPVKFIWDDPEVVASLEDVSEEEAPSIEETSDLYDLKVLFLGEEGVGVNSIIFECNLKLGNDYSSLHIPNTNSFTYSNIVEHKDSNIRVDAWTFPKSMEAKIPKTEFYTGAGMAVLVYSVADRWSFDSLDFWVREVSNAFLIPPPIIIVGNKTDLRDHPVYDEDDEVDTPVTTEEARAYCDEVAKSLGENGRSHPVFFIETSTITGQGITELLNKIVDFWVVNERPSMPATEQNVPTH